MEQGETVNQNELRFLPVSPPAVTFLLEGAQTVLYGRGAEH